MTDTAGYAYPAETDRVGPVDTGGKNPDVDEAVAKLDSAITNLLENDEAFRLFLEYKGAMHNYSWLNMLLIYADYLQREHSGPVLTMGYKGWITQGRKVKPGSKAISLFKPILKFWRDYDKVNPSAKNAKWDKDRNQWYYLKSKATGFEIIRKTFHIQDTDGPEYDVPQPVVLEDNSEEASRIYDELGNACMELGVTAVTQGESTHGENGSYNPATKSIHIVSGLSFAQQAKTLVHELAHHVSFVLGLDHHEFYTSTRGAAEAVVEGSAFIVMASYGIDSSQYSVPYIAQWGSDINAIRRLLRDMDKVARAIIEKLPQGAKEEASA